MMKRRHVAITVTDHAVIRFMERALDIDVDQLRSHIAGLAQDGVELGAIGIKLEHYKIVTLYDDHLTADGKRPVVIPTVLDNQMIGDIKAIMRQQFRSKNTSRRKRRSQ